MTKRRATGHGVTRAGDAISLVLSHLGYGKRHSALWAMAVWDRAAGEAVSRHAQPEIVRGTTLHVVVDSATWAQELRFLEVGIVHKLNAEVGRSCVDGLRYRIGRLPVRAHYELAETPPPLRPLAVAKDLAAAQESDDVNAAWARLVAVGEERAVARRARETAQSATSGPEGERS